MIFFTIVLSFSKGWSALFKKIRTHHKFNLILPALLIGSNWTLYIWAVNHGHVIETSLGYYICPLISVALAVIFLKEKLRLLQWIAIGIAFSGVLAMTLIYGKFPWIAMVLAITWALYGLRRKESPFNAVEGLTFETACMSIIALTVLGYITYTGNGTFVNDPTASALLMGTGFISGFPLIIFIAGARLINLPMIGFLQYVYPTLIFLMGFIVFKEPVNDAKLTGLIVIWIALIIFSIDSIRQVNKSK